MLAGGWPRLAVTSFSMALAFSRIALATPFQLVSWSAVTLSAVFSAVMRCSTVSGLLLVAAAAAGGLLVVPCAAYRAERARQHRRADDRGDGKRPQKRREQMRRRHLGSAFPEGRFPLCRMARWDGRARQREAYGLVAARLMLSSPNVEPIDRDCRRNAAAGRCSRAGGRAQCRAARADAARALPSSDRRADGRRQHYGVHRARRWRGGGLRRSQAPCRRHRRGEAHVHAALAPRAEDRRGDRRAHRGAGAPRRPEAAGAGDRRPPSRRLDGLRARRLHALRAGARLS